MPETRCEILVKKAVVSGFSWDDIENFFCINRNFLLEELRSFFARKKDGAMKMHLVEAKIKSNQRPAAEYDFERD